MKMIMNVRRLLTIALALCATIFMANCSKDKKGSNDESESTGVTATNEEIAKNIATTYQEGFVEFEKILDKYPKANQEMKDEFEKLYDETLKKMVAFGKLVEQKDEADKEKIGSLVFSHVMDMDNLQGILNKFNDRTFEISKFDEELDHKMTHFNIITQYAFYDLLKKQNPEEAERLGIE